MKKKEKRLAVLASVGPYAAETLLLVVLPLLYVCLMSIMTRPSYGGVEFTVSFNGYRALFEKAYLVAIWNSVRMSLVSTVIILLVSYPMAYMLSRCSRRVASNLIILMMIPYFTNSLIRLYSYITLFNTKGILTGILARLGMTWSADFLYSESAVVLGLVYVCIPYAVLPMYSSIERLDKALLENPIKGEFFLPLAVSQLIAEKKATVTVLTSPDKWYGVTYAADKPAVVAALRRMTDEGKYPDGLWK